MDNLQAEQQVVTPKDAATPNPENVIEEPASGSMVAEGDPEVSDLYRERVVNKPEAAKADTLGRPEPINTHSVVEEGLEAIRQNEGQGKTAADWSTSFFLPGMNTVSVAKAESDLLSGLYS